MVALNHESVKEIKAIIVRKVDWTISFSTDVHPGDMKNWFELIMNDVRLGVGSRTGAFAVMMIVAKIVGQPFRFVDENKNYINFRRQDCVEKWGAARSAASC